MRKIYRFTVLGICAVMMASCGKKSEIVRGELAQAINAGVAFSEPLTEIDSAAAERLLFLNPNDYSELTMYIGTEATSDEFVIISTSNPDTVKEKLSNYLAAETSSYNAYRPAEAMKLSNAFMDEYKGTITLIVSPDPENARQVYEQYLKK